MPLIKITQLQAEMLNTFRLIRSASVMNLISKRYSSGRGSLPLRGQKYFVWTTILKTSNSGAMPL